jgi:hypothetical protein
MPINLLQGAPERRYAARVIGMRAESVIGIRAQRPIGLSGIRNLEVPTYDHEKFPPLRANQSWCQQRPKTEPYYFPGPILSDRLRGLRDRGWLKIECSRESRGGIAPPSLRTLLTADRKEREVAV